MQRRATSRRAARGGEQDRPGPGRPGPRAAGHRSKARRLDGRSSDAEAGAEYFPVSAPHGHGVDACSTAIVARLPEGPAYFPDDMVTDTPEALRVAELVREQLLARARDELPHSIACRVTEWEWPRIRCEILVERDSQKGIVIGKGGEVLKAVGTAVRAELARRAPTSSSSSQVEKHWQQRDELSTGSATEIGSAPTGSATERRLLGCQRPGPGYGDGSLRERPARKSSTCRRSVGPAHRRQRGEQHPPVAGGGQPRVEHGHHAAVVGRPDRAGPPPGPAAWPPAAGRPAGRRASPARSRRAWQQRVVGAGEGQPVEGHERERAARARRRPARSRGWRTGTTSRRSANAARGGGPWAARPARAAV